MNAPKAMIKMMLTFCFILALPISTPAGDMPDTGQTQCYDNAIEMVCPSEGADFYGQDGQYDGPARAYTKVGNKGVALPDTATVADGWLMTRDNATGLIWETKTDDGTIHDKDNQYTWYDSNAASPGTPGDGTDTEDFVHALNSAKFGGFTDWRMPTVKELATLIINDGQIHPAIDTDFFPITADHCYWSSTTYAPDPTKAWGVGFETGDDSLASKSDRSRCVRAVRGASSGVLGNSIISGRMADNGDGTVTDSETGLMWQQTTAPGQYTWQGALAYAEALILPLAGHSDWRLPNRNELQTLVDYTRSGPATDPDAFPGTFGSLYWSSTTEASDPGNTWGVKFDYGSQWSSSDKILINAYVRAVRGGHTGPISPPAIAQAALSGLPGTKFVREGEGFTPNSTAILYFSGPGIAEPLKQNQAIGADGSFEITSSYPDKPSGSFSWWAEDGETGRWSNVVIYKISCPFVGPRSLLLSE